MSRSSSASIFVSCIKRAFGAALVAAFAPLRCGEWADIRPALDLPQLADRTRFAEVVPLPLLSLFHGRAHGQGCNYSSTIVLDAHVILPSQAWVFVAPTSVGDLFLHAKDLLVEANAAVMTITINRFFSRPRCLMQYSVANMQQPQLLMRLWHMLFVERQHVDHITDEDAFFRVEQ
jgi:hypothetical protein